MQLAPRGIEQRLRHVAQRVEVRHGDDPDKHGDGDEEGVDDRLAGVGQEGGSLVVVVRREDRQHDAEDERDQEEDVEDDVRQAAELPPTPRRLGADRLRPVAETERINLGLNHFIEKELMGLH